MQELPCNEVGLPKTLKGSSECKTCSNSTTFSCILLAKRLQQKEKDGVSSMVEVIKPLVEEWIKTVQLLLVQSYQALNLSVEDASPPSQSYDSTERSLQELIVDYEDKIKKLKKAIEALSQRQSSNYFEEYELYYLIKHVEDPNWIHLMRILRVSEEEMERCRNLSRDRREQKYQMLKVWLRHGQNGITSYKNELIIALELIDCTNVASMFKSGRSVMSTPL